MSRPFLFMRSLFAKIFLWFWLAHAVLVCGVVVMVWIQGDNPHTRHDRFMASLLRTHGDHCMALIARDGPAAAQAHLARLAEDIALHITVVDAENRGLDGAPATPPLAALAQQARSRGSLVRQSDRRQVTVALPYDDPDCVQCCVVAQMPPRGGGFIAPWHIAVLLLWSGGVCYLLARHLGRPVQVVADAAQRLANGDLSVRVGQIISPARRDDLGRLAANFDDMAEHLEKLIAIQQRLLRDVSHELRSPLARLCVALGIAQESDGAAREQALQRIDREAEHLNDMIGKLLAIAQLEGAPERIAGSVDLAALVDHVTADADYEAQSRNRRAVVTASTPCFANGHPELLHSAIENVVRNAVTYTAEHTTVEVRLERVGDGDRPIGVITVRDRGPGLNDSQLTDVFRPFYRVADAREPNTGGAGLGLAIARSAIHSHGGALTASHAEGSGLVVTIRLPLSDDPSGSGPD